jgi:two-component system, chemotaxis family, CheB/CheR fusion protein
MEPPKSDGDQSLPDVASKPPAAVTPDSRGSPELSDHKGTPANKKRPPRQRVQSGTDESPPGVLNRETPDFAQNPGFPIVAIGASAGGLEALDELFHNMPADTGMAFVVVTHLPSGHTSLLPELLSRETSMPVVEAVEATQVQPNHVYIYPPGGPIAIINGVLHQRECDQRDVPRLPIDQFFRSLAEDQKGNAICIVLSGTGTDGTLGLRAIKGESGMAMVQQPQSAKFSGMPSNAIATNLADYVLPPSAMPKQLIAYAKSPSLLRAAVHAPDVPTGVMQKIFELLRNRTGNDFSSYKTKTLHRRIERRMNVHQIKEPEQYLKYLQQNPPEIDALFNELLISVTNFFRDPDAWKSLAPWLTNLIASRPDNYTVRAWVPGCSTGEEVYSLAISLRECIDKCGRPLKVQIFGTDLDADAIEAARIGQYPEGIGVDVSPERLQRYFVLHNGYFRICKEIREMTIFAPQNLIKDPPFTKLDMISCRNVLIYLNSDLQKRLLPIFHYAMKPDGLLFQGPSETVGAFTELFEPLDKRWRIYRRKDSPTSLRRLPDMPAQPRTRSTGEADPSISSPLVKQTHLSTLIERSLLNRFAPVSIVVNDHGEIVFIHGRTGQYLEPSPGQPGVNIVEMAREGLQIELAAAIRECVAAGGEIVRHDIRVKTNGDYSVIDLTVTKLAEPEALRDLLLVTLRTVPSTPQQAPGRKKKTSNKSGQGDHIERLERELRSMRESQQTTLAELETSNEELKSANEESQSTNEELQSANEELETAAEEMQSLNEELTTVNAELQSKVDELSQANNDMQNLLNSTDIATIFLDQDLNVKRFTNQATKLVTLRPTDVGRPITELASNVSYGNLAEACHGVLKTLLPIEREVVTTEGVWYLMRIMLYRTTDNVIDGLVITFVNIKQLKDAKKAEASRAYFESIFETVREPLVVLDDKRRVVSANRCFYSSFRMRPSQVQGQCIWEIGDGAWNIPALRELLDELLPQNSSFDAFEVEHEFPKIGRKVFILNARRLEPDTVLPGMILLAFEDVTGK